MAKKKAKKPDPRMLKYLDVLMNMEVLENEENWDDIESLDEESGDSSEESYEEDSDEA